MPLPSARHGPGDPLLRVGDQGRRNTAVDTVNGTAEKLEECTAFSVDSNERQIKRD